MYLYIFRRSFELPTDSVVAVHSYNKENQSDHERNVKICLYGNASSLFLLSYWAWRLLLFWLLFVCSSCFLDASLSLFLCTGSWGYIPVLRHQSQSLCRLQSLGARWCVGMTHFGTSSMKLRKADLRGWEAEIQQPQIMRSLPGKLRYPVNLRHLSNF